MANYFELSDTYIEQLKNYRDDTTPLIKVLENSQNILFQAYLTRRNNKKEGYFDEEIAPFVLLRYYQGNGRFILCDINSYKEGWHKDISDVPSENVVSSPVLDLLDDSLTLKNNDQLAKSLETYPTITDWFKRLLDKIPSSSREEISLDGIKIKKFQEILKEEKQNIIKEETETKKKEPIIKQEVKKREKPKHFLPKGKQTKKVEVKTVSFKYQDELEEKKLIALQERANNLSLRIKKKVGIHFGWDELFVYARNGSDMLTMIDKKVRKKGLKQQDNDWIIVATYTIEDEDFAYIKERYPNHAYRSDDINHKPSAEFVSLAIVVSPIKNETPKADNGVKKVTNKAVSFVNVAPEAGYSASDDVPYDDEEEMPVVRKPNDGVIKKVKYKGAIFSNNINENPAPTYLDDDFEDVPLPSVNPDEYVLPDYQDEEEIPDHWKCPFCPSRNPWHTEEPARTIKKSDGTSIYLCKKHKNCKIN